MKLNREGNIVDLYESFPKLIKIISTGDKMKIVRACYFLLGQVLHWMKSRPDILVQIFKLGPYTNEVFIELHNSTISRRVDHMELLFQNIRDESVDVQFARTFFNHIKAALELSGGDGD